MNQIRILLTCCLGDYMKSTIDAYRNSPIGERLFIVGTDMNDMLYNFPEVDKFYKVSKCDDTSYIDELFDICSKERINVLIPFHTNELEPLSVESNRFNKIGTTVIVSDIEGLEIANDKAKWYEYFVRHGINTPDTLVTNDFFAARDFVQFGNGKKYVIKQRHNCGGRGFAVIGCHTDTENDKTKHLITMTELEEILNGHTEYLIQEYLPGTEYTVDVVADNGTVYAAVCKKNDDMVEGVARTSTVIHHDYCEMLCSEVCRLLKLTGNIGFDLKEDSTGKPVIIDINPRITATISLVAASGVNLPYMALLLALGKKPDENFTPRYGTKIIRKVTDYFFDEEMKPIVW